MTAPCGYHAVTRSVTSASKLGPKELLTTLFGLGYSVRIMKIYRVFQKKVAIDVLLTLF